MERKVRDSRPPGRGKRVPEVEINERPILQTHKKKTVGKQILSSL
ncbi:hypothetical protein ABWK46_01700 [Peribacillus frigoritolerans]